MEEDQQIFIGVLKNVSPKEGYGFISCPVLQEAFGRDVYVTASKLPPGACAGCSVEFTLHINSKGQPQAQRVSLSEGSPVDLDEAARLLCTDFLQLASDLDTYTIVLQKKRGTRLGIEVDTTHGLGGLLVHTVKDGLVEAWNKSNPDVQVRVGDQIIEVNGVVGDADALVAQCKVANRLQMRLLREPTEAQCTSSGSSGLPSLQVVCWNILAGAYASLKTYPDVQPSVLHSSRRRAQVAAALAYLSADVICLQEVDCSLDELGLSSEYDCCEAQRPEGRCDRCVIAWKRARLELGPAGHRMVSFDEHLPPRPLGADIAHYSTGSVGLVAELRVRSDPCKRCITVATTHLCWEPHKTEVRAWQLHTLWGIVSTFAGPRILLCGDLNSLPGSQPPRFLSDGCGLLSAYRDLESSVLTNSNAHAGLGGFAAMIDYVWYSAKWFALKQRLRLPTADELKASAAAQTEGAAALPPQQRPAPCVLGPVPTLLSASWPSDHLALSAVFELTNPVLNDVWDLE
mmetsp:Transcript_77958/g.252895  ORF Transcript_77958/g.252895 Transcript_77958/m.252895 type:complete len:515 (+) Transcript_77958:173-1717(+)|eukprot:CAMPEP_0203871970 /NCGR_PEP_ID=MMETSP0359-20131031/19008_1 /ASSEMBLY_ACC=CAM_ASM_000338 /TAXON_ID=268821 /ORGANISM="Scrippsiella Hangoei, Strain SHTV-5" /LENGTH=514 /DNA_ID=CAMNT_0050790651 /DNA_START=147 /DNA_END=1691 /DNA_ORIENTATION=+